MSCYSPKMGTPFEGPWLPPAERGTVEERHAAARMVLRMAGDREDDARTVLQALGLLPSSWEWRKPTPGSKRRKVATG